MVPFYDVYFETYGSEARVREDLRAAVSDWSERFNLLQVSHEKSFIGSDCDYVSRETYIGLAGGAFRLLTFNKDLFDEASSLVSKFDDETCNPEVVISQGGALTTGELPPVPFTKFEPGNYPREVASMCEEALEYISGPREDLNRGRILLLSGIPGTGKTFLIKSFLSSKKYMDRVKAVLVPGKMVSVLGDPDFMNMLRRCVVQSDRGHGLNRLLLVIEEGDKMLATRTEKSQDHITTLLNLGDGLLGETLDVRVMTTTNAVLEDLDPAVRRKGRLAYHIKLDTLSVEEANAFFDRNGSALRVDKPTVLSDLYAMLKGLDEADPDGEVNEAT